MALPYATENQLKLLEQKTKSELDKKTANINLTANTLDDMNALIASGAVNDGQLCYLKEDKKLYVLKDGKWGEVGGGGGASVSPMLNLMDFSGDSPVARTSITEEEKQNIEKGLYNSVLYIDASLGDASFYSFYFSEPAFYMDGTFIFSMYKFSLDETTESGSVTSLRGYSLSIGEKNPDETYPITIESLMEIPFGSGSSNLPVIVKKAINNKVTITEDEFDKLASGKYSLSVFSTDSSGFTSSLIFTDVAVKALSEGKPDNIGAISSSIVFNDPIIVQQDYRLNFSRNNLVSDITSSFTPMTQSKLLNKKVMTYGTFTSENLLPCTTADNGKVLSVVNGEAQWASASGEKTLTISITDILTDNSKIQELFSKMTSTTEQSALILFDNQINYNTYKDYDTIKLDLSPLSSMGISGYYILRNQSHINGYTSVYSLTTVGFSTSGNNLDKLVIKHLIIAGNDEVNTPLNKFLLKIL